MFKGKKGTFSWGTTHDVFPIDIKDSPNNYFYFTYNENESKKFKLRYSYNYDDAGVSYDDIGDYDTIWRYE